jgi:hypothetical protein
MLTFLRWRERDADVIAPSFYAGRTRKRDDEPESPEPIAAPAIVTAPAVVTAPVNPIPPGMPGADPFQS